MLLASEGCTSELIIPDTEGSGGAAGERDASASGGGLIINMDALDFTPVNVANCGNGSLDKGESCDDRNTFEGDGCSRLCQLEADFDCPEAGRPCILRAVCGDGKLASTETCDDGEQEDGDGCSAKCTTIEAGWQCRVPGKRCVPLCGDGKITATEKCDDGNALSGDGCSSTCHVEPGYTCGAPNTPCTKSVCGNSKTELGELCDDGDKNGLFYGDGKGCSKTCTKEPNCRDSSGRNQACTTSCGDGNLDPGEPCDDGNLVSGDGCSQDCQREAGFSCTPRTLQDASPCQSGIGECLQLPIVYRDFQPENVTPGGHPDFYFLGTKNSSGAIKTWCVPNSGGPAWGNDSTARCWDIAAPDLLNGKPQYNPARADNMCACQFSDWSRKGNGGHVPNYADSESPLWDPAQRPPDFRADMTSWTANGGPIWKGKVPIVKDKKSFDQWFNDDSTVNKTFTAVLELASIGTNTYRYSSVSHLTQGGFFPLNTLNPSQATLCNLWPYWHNWPGCTGDQYLFPPRVVQADCPFQVPLTNGCWVTGLTGVKNDSYFTTEARYYFAYDGTTGLTLQFFGDDDLFIFINGKLVLDLGGVHQQTPGRVTVMGDPGVADVVEGGCLDAFGDITTTQAGYQAAGCTPTNSTPPAPVSPADFRIRTVPLGLKTGVVYEIAIFGADRHPPESNYQLTLNGFTTKRSDCEPRCGDGIVSGGEECDDGDKNNDTVYGGCTTECKFGPFCGDEVTNGPEECDLGRGNGASYGLDGCTWACMKPHFCGDGVVDTTRGESCDLGPANGTSGSRCTTKCRLIVD